MNTPASIPYLLDPVRTIPVYPLIWSKCEALAERDLAWAKRVSHDKAWQEQASTLSLDTVRAYLGQSLDYRTRHHYGYWYLRAHSVAGHIAIDPQLRREWVELGGKLD